MKKHAHPFVRRTLPLKGTVSRLEVQLDHPAALAIAYARNWHRDGPAATGVDPLASGVIRRALAVYMTHLAAATTDAQAEARAVRACCGSIAPDAEDRKAAIDRLRGRDPGQPFPAWLDVLYGFDHAEKLAAFEERVEAVVSEVNRRRPSHTYRRKASTT